jgi:DNA polymerase sigma
MSLSSFTLALLVIAYLQHEGHLPNLQRPDLIEHIGEKETHLWLRPSNSLRSFHRKAPFIQDLAASDVTPRVRCDTTFVTATQLGGKWKQVPLALGDAFVGFFAFYAQFNFHHQMISIADGGVLDRDTPYVSLDEVARVKICNADGVVISTRDTDFIEGGQLASPEADPSRSPIPAHLWSANVTAGAEVGKRDHQL